MPQCATGNNGSASTSESVSTCTDNPEVVFNKVVEGLPGEAAESYYNVTKFDENSGAVDSEDEADNELFMATATFLLERLKPGLTE